MADAVAEPRPLGAGLTERERIVIVLTLVTALFVGNAEQQIVAVAAPSVVASLGGFSLLPWVFTSTMVASTIMMPVVGKLSDSFGSKPCMLIGLGVFIAGSVGCAAATSMPMLITFRVFQGLGSGAVGATVSASIGELFPSSERGKYYAWFTGCQSLAQITGPTIGGFITDSAGWRWCFAIAVPLALLAAIVVAVRLPSRQQGSRPVRIDALGMALLSVSTTSLLLGLSWAQKDYGWTAPLTLALLSASPFGLALFILQERRHPDAIMPLWLFRRRNFVWGVLLSGLVSGSIAATLTYLPTFVQVALGASATVSGLITTPQAVAALAGSLIAGQVISRAGGWRIQLGALLLFMVVGFAIIAVMDVGDSTARISLGIACVGFGFAGLMASLSVIVLNAVPARSIGVATGARIFGLQIGGVLAIAVMGIVFSSSYDEALDQRLGGAVRAELPPSVVTHFDDPTFPLDKPALAAAEAEVAGLPRGPELFASAVDAQRHAVARANRAVFLSLCGIIVAALVVAWLIREETLRGFETAAEQQEPAAV